MSLELKNVSKRVAGITHVKETSLTLHPGHFNVLLGETGSGKTSLIKLMAGLDSLATGQIVLNGKDVSRLSAQKRNISLVHQFFVNYPHMSVFDNIASPLKVAGVARSEIEGRVEEAAKLIISFGMVTPDRLPDGAIPQAEPGKAGAGLMPDDTPPSDQTDEESDTQA